MGDGASDLSGLVAVVTGAGRGLGRAHALRLAAGGAAVVVNDVGASASGHGRDGSVSARVVDEITATGGRAVANDVSIASFEGATSLVDAALEHFGAVHIVVNNAGFVTSTALADLEEHHLRELMDVHFIGTVGMMRAAIPHMMAARDGRIVNTLS